MIHKTPAGIAHSTVTAVTNGCLFRQATTTVPFRVEDWCDRILGHSWMDANNNLIAIAYAIRAASSGLPIDNEVLYGKTPDGLSHLVHVSEVA